MINALLIVEVLGHMHIYISVVYYENEMLGRLCAAHTKHRLLVCSCAVLWKLATIAT